MGVTTTFLRAPAHPRRWLLLGLAALLLFVSARYVVKASEDRSAFVRWRNQLHGLGQGEDIYQRYIYPNAPMMAIILYPLSIIPDVPIGSFNLNVGALLWFALKVAMTLLAFIWTVRLVEKLGAPFPPWAQVTALLLSLRPIIGDLSHGNVNLLILFLVVAALLAFKRGHDWLTGLVLALSITCKVTPALFVPYFLWKRAWKTLAGCALGLGLFFFVVPGTFLGHAHNARLLQSWVKHMILPYTLKGEVITEHCNQSLPGVLYRLCTHKPSFLDDEDEPAEYHNLVDADPAILKRVVQACGLGFLLLMIWSCRTPTKDEGGRMKDEARTSSSFILHPSSFNSNWRLAAEFSIVILGMLLFSERTWKHHCVTLLLPFAVLCYYLATQGPSAGRRRYLIASITVATIIMASTSTGLWQPFGFVRGAKLAQTFGAYVWAELILLAALVTILVHPRRTDPG